MNLLNQFSFNMFGLIIIVVMLTPNIFFYFMSKEEKQSNHASKALLIVEQIGRFGSMLTMVIVLSYKPVSENRKILMVLICAMLTVLYVWTWRAYFFKKSKTLKLTLAILPIIIFVTSAVMMYNIPLLIFSLLFGVTHIIITKQMK